MRLLVLHGLPGVGKLTVAKELARLTGYKLFHNHLTVDLVASVFEFGSRPFVDLRESIWLSVIERAAAEGVPGLLFTFVFERTVPEGFMAKLRQAVEGHGGSVRLIELTCSPAELEGRVEEPSRRAFGKLQSAQMLQNLIDDGSLHTPAWVRSDLVIDTTGLSPAETAERILQGLG